MEREESLCAFKKYLQRRFPDRRTSKDYMGDLRQFQVFCSKAWREVDLHDIDAFVDSQRQAGLKPATIKRRAAALKTFFDFLAEESGDLSWPNPVRMKRHAGKQPIRLPRDVNEEVVQCLWQVIAKRRDRAWFALMLRAGLRVGEVVDLKLADLLRPAQADQAAQVRVCGKGRKERIVLLSADADAVLQAWLRERPQSPTDHIFLNERDGGPLSVSGIEYCLKQYAQQVGVNVSPHQLRHTYARQLTEAGMPITSLGKLMGHAQVSTTQIYTAGADPTLASAYQHAMQQLEQARLPAVTDVPAAVRTDPPPLAVERKTKPMDWASWARHLPAAIRQACLAFVQRRFPTWKTRRQREQALRVCGELRRFWDWQLETRPIATPGELTLQDLQRYQQDRTKTSVTARTVDITLGRVVSLLADLADQGQPVQASVFRWRPRRRPDSLPRHLTNTEACQLHNYVMQRLDSQDPGVVLENTAYLLLAQTGLRAGECQDVCLQDVNLQQGRLVVRQGKGQRDRVVYFTPLVTQALQRYLSRQPRPANAPLLALPNGRPFSYAWLYQHLLTLGQSAGVAHLTAHRLRHTLATRLLNAGMEITRIQKLLGHQQVNTTMIYARIFDTTVEGDYRQAMQQIERQQMPLSNIPIPLSTDSICQNERAIVHQPIDNSV